MKKMTSVFAMMTKKTKISRVARLGGALGLAMLLAVPAVLLAPARTASAQRGATQRTLEGVVQNSAGTNVKGAVVYLKDTKSLSVKSFVSTDAGTFHFSQLSPDTDYDVWAESQGKKSKTKSISQFNSKQQFNYTLKIED